MRHDDFIQKQFFTNLRQLRLRAIYLRYEVWKIIAVHDFCSGAHHMSPGMILNKKHKVLYIWKINNNVLKFSSVYDCTVANVENFAAVL